MKSATYNGKLYASPVSSDGGLLFYRKDLVKTPPKTWDEMMADCKTAKQKKIGCYAGQFTKYEGLTVNAAEAINTDGGTIVGKDGATPTVDSPEAVKGLTRLVDAYKNGDIPKEAITFQEEQGRQAFEAGKLMFLRNWTYVYGLAKSDSSSKVKNTFGVAPLPGTSGPGASSLGGHNAAISVYSDHKATAHDFLQYLTGAEFQKFELTQGTLAPVVPSPLQRRGSGEEVPVPAGPADLDPERRAAPGHAVLPRGHEGDPGQLLRGVEGAEIAATGCEGHVRGHQRRIKFVDAGRGPGHRMMARTPTAPTEGEPMLLKQGASGEARRHRGTRRGARRMLRRHPRRRRACAHRPDDHPARDRHRLPGAPRPSGCPSRRTPRSTRPPAFVRAASRASQLHPLAAPSAVAATVVPAGHPRRGLLEVVWITVFFTVVTVSIELVLGFGSR